MLKSRLERVDGRLLVLRPVYPELRTLLRQPLLAIRVAVRKNPQLADVDADGIGLKVWLLPQRYLRNRALNNQLRTKLTEFAATHVDRPSMILAAEVRGAHVRPTGRRWAIGKGLIGSAVFGSDNESFFSVIHREFGDAYTLSWWKFKRLPDEQRRNRRRKDMKALQDTYATAVAVGIRESAMAPAFGCITLDTPAGCELKNSQIEACADILVSFVPQILQIIVNEGGYGLDFG